MGKRGCFAQYFGAAVGKPRIRPRQFTQCPERTGWISLGAKTDDKLRVIWFEPKKAGHFFQS